jgi:hypothetical protein
VNACGARIPDAARRRCSARRRRAVPTGALSDANAPVENVLTAAPLLRRVVPQRAVEAIAAKKAPSRLSAVTRSSGRAVLSFGRSPAPR